MCVRICMVAGLALVAFDVAARGCPWDKATFSFKGSAPEQAACLLRSIRPGGIVEDTNADLPPSMKASVAQPVRIDRSAFRQYLQSNGLEQASVGGRIDAPLSATKGQLFARYFVIHDTSTIHCKAAFPDTTDMPEQPWNKASTWEQSGQAHLFITRGGDTVQPQGRTFGTPWRATRLEATLGTASRGLFLHVENVQLRRPDVAMGGRLTGADGKTCINDRIAEQPGLTATQYRRLAEAYVGASIRKGAWLIPAFHAVIDADIPGGHDDPQNFDLAVWASAVCEVRAAVANPC